MSLGAIKSPMAGLLERAMCKIGVTTVAINSNLIFYWLCGKYKLSLAAPLVAAVNQAAETKNSRRRTACRFSCGQILSRPRDFFAPLSSAHTFLWSRCCMELAKLEQFEAPAECEGHICCWDAPSRWMKLKKFWLHTLRGYFVIFSLTSDSSKIRHEYSHIYCINSFCKKTDMSKFKLFTLVYGCS